MSDRARLKIQFDGIDTRAQIEQIERNLKALPSVEFHDLGINEVTVHFDEHETSRGDVEYAIEQAGGSIREALPEQ